jgi:methylmalonyl-CoA/ethylmalonyl-CoA epimerase
MTGLELAEGLPRGEPPTGQVAFVVDSLIDAIGRWTDLNIGPWNVWTFDERILPTRTYRGAPGSWAARVALCSIGALTYELIEGLAGPSIYEGWLGTATARPHHLGYYVEDIDVAIAAMADRGFDVVQSGAGFGLDGDGAFAYFDTVEAFGLLRSDHRPKGPPTTRAAHPADRMTSPFSVSAGAA